jgi:DNA-directed RNA polymerase sigma subunit (sigma70/sigma32)
VNLYDPTNPKSEGIDVVQDHNIEEVFADKDLNGLLKLLTSDLNTTYKKLLYMSHGVDGSGEDMNNSDMRGAFNNISRERIRQKKILAVNKVKHRAERLGITREVLLENLT